MNIQAQQSAKQLQSYTKTRVENSKIHPIKSLQVQKRSKAFPGRYNGFIGFPLASGVEFFVKVGEGIVKMVDMNLKIILEYFYSVLWLQPFTAQIIFIMAQWTWALTIFATVSTYSE